MPGLYFQYTFHPHGRGVLLSLRVQLLLLAPLRVEGRLRTAPFKEVPTQGSRSPYHLIDAQLFESTIVDGKRFKGLPAVMSKA